MYVSPTGLPGWPGPLALVRRRQTVCIRAGVDTSLCTHMTLLRQTIRREPEHSDACVATRERQREAGAQAATRVDSAQVDPVSGSGPGCVLYLRCSAGRLPPAHAYLKRYVARFPRSRRCTCSLRAALRMHRTRSALHRDSLRRFKSRRRCSTFNAMPFATTLCRCAVARSTAAALHMLTLLARRARRHGAMREAAESQSALFNAPCGRGCTVQQQPLQNRRPGLDSPVRPDGP